MIGGDRRYRQDGRPYSDVFVSGVSLSFCGVVGGFYQTVFKVDGPVCYLGKSLVMRHDHECLSESVAEIEEKLMQFLLVFCVQTARGLIGKDDGRIVYQCSGKG